MGVLLSKLQMGKDGLEYVPSGASVELIVCGNRVYHVYFNSAGKSYTCVELNCTGSRAWVLSRIYDHASLAMVKIPQTLEPGYGERRESSPAESGPGASPAG